MNKRIFALLAALCIALGCLAGCTNDEPVKETEGSSEQAEWVDYAASIPLDMSSETAKQKVSVKAYIDGDTTHFNVPGSVSEGGILKARYLAVNTPESTGKIEEWGKKASSFTKSRLESASEIIIESDDENWNVDSTGGRYLVWVWYKPSGSETFRNLNIELLQEGLSIASSAGKNRYGQVCMDALMQAKAYNLHMHSKEKDPDFYYGDAFPVTLKELRSNLPFYENKKVTFEGVITYESGQTVYAEEYDAETDTYYGISVYYGYGINGTGIKILKPGNRVAFVGSVQYYEEGKTWQLSDIQYVDMRPNDPNNVQLISSGHEPGNRLTDGKTFKTGKMEVEVKVLDEDGGEVFNDQGEVETTTETRDYREMVLGTSISMENLRVESIDTTTKENSANNGALTLSCRTADGYVISVRTVVLHDENGEVITAEAYQGKTINVKGVVDYYVYNGYQVKVFSPDDITIVR